MNNSNFNAADIAISLYNDGWQSEHIAEIAHMHKLTIHQASDLMEELVKLESKQDMIESLGYNTY